MSAGAQIRFVPGIRISRLAVLRQHREGFPFIRCSIGPLARREEERPVDPPDHRSRWSMIAEDSLPRFSLVARCKIHLLSLPAPAIVIHVLLMAACPESSTLPATGLPTESCPLIKFSSPLYWAPGAPRLSNCPSRLARETV